MSMESRIKEKLSTLSPLSLTVTDDSARHAGHSGARAGGETHFSVAMVSSVFSGMTRVQRHRLIHQLLEAELNESVHALSLALRAPEET